jgi:hypothetical protein
MSAIFSLRTSLLTPAWCAKSVVRRYIAKIARLTWVWCEAYGESGRMAVASGPKADEGPVPIDAVWLRSPRVKRSRISSRSLGDASNDAVNSVRSAGVPPDELLFHCSRIDASVGG